MKANRSKTYLIPLLLREISFDTSYFPHIYNTYISDSKDEYKDCIFIEFVGDDIENYREFKESLRENSSCVNIIANEKKDIFVFKFPKKYLDEYNWFKQSKYSRYGVDAKVYITSF